MAAAAPAEAEAMHAAIAALEAMGAPALLEMVLGTARGPMILQLRTQVAAEEARIARAVDEVLMPSILAAAPAMVAATASVYARHFTPAELREIAAFHALPEPRDRAAFDATPTGMKFLALAETLNTEGNTANSVAMKSAIDEALRRHGPDLRAHVLETRVLESRA